MAIYTKGADNTYTTTDDGFVDDLIGGFKAPFLKTGELVDGTSALYGQLIYGVGVTIASSMITRKRAANGAKPLAGVFF